MNTRYLISVMSIATLLLIVLSIKTYEHELILSSAKTSMIETNCSLVEENNAHEQRDNKDFSILKQDFFQQNNKTYYIKNNYILVENVTIPENCVLKFEGGTISGPFSIIGKHTMIEAGLEKIFGSDITLSGNWNVNSWNICWFGASVANNDNSPYIKKALDVVYSLGTSITNGYGFNDCGIFIPSGVYRVVTQINVNCRFNIYGNGTSSIIYSNCPSNLFVIKGVRGTISLNNVSFICDDKVRTSCNCISLNTEQGTALGRITNCDFINFNVALDLYNPYWLRISNCNFVYTNGYSIKAKNANSFSIMNSNFRSIDGRNTSAHHLFFTGDMQGVCITGCDFSGSYRSSIKLDKANGYGVQISGNYFEPGFMSVFMGGLIEADNSNITDLLFKANAAYESKAFDANVKNMPRYFILLRNSKLYRSDVVGNLIIDGNIRGNSNSLVGRIYNYLDFEEGNQNYLDTYYALIIQAKGTSSTNELNSITKRLNHCCDVIQKKMVDVSLITKSIKNFSSVFYRFQNVEDNVEYTNASHISNVETSGKFANKPSPSQIYIGFQYFNTDTHRIITWGDGKWWNPDGTEAIK